MNTKIADLALVDAFEKIRAYLLERDPGLEAGALARPADPGRWKRLSAREYQEVLLAVLLGIDRRTPAGRRAVRDRLRSIGARDAVADGRQVADGGPLSPRDELFRVGGRERWVRRHIGAIGQALDRLGSECGDDPPALVGEIERCARRREVVALVGKRIRPLRGLRLYEFLEQVGYPVVVPDAARQRLFHRLGWMDRTTPASAFPQLFFELCERLVHLAGESWSVVHAATGLFAGSRDQRAVSAESPAVCTARARCGSCVLTGQCAYYRYRGEAPPVTSRSVKTMAYAEQPRTRFEVLGAGQISEVELLALIIRTGTGGKSSLDLARDILEQFGSLEALARAGLGELCQIRGVGRAKAIELKAALELGRRLFHGGPVAVGEAIRRSADIFRIYRGLLEEEQQENFYLVVLNARNRIQSRFLIARGSLTSSQVHPREVMKAAIREAAAAVIFVHNHPSGDAEPSRDDIEITRRLVEAARVVGIRVHDHVIIGRGDYYSFADHHLLEPQE